LSTINLQEILQLVNVGDAARVLC